MSHTVMVEFNCKPGKGPTVLRALVAASGIPVTRSQDGAEMIEPYVDIDDPDRIIVWQKWASLHQQQAYDSWRNDGESMDAFNQLLAEPARAVHLNAG